MVGPTARKLLHKIVEREPIPVFAKLLLIASGVTPKQYGRHRRDESVLAYFLKFRFDHPTGERSLICFRKARICIVGLAEHEYPQPIDRSGLVRRANPRIKVALA